MVTTKVPEVGRTQRRRECDTAGNTGIRLLTTLRAALVDASTVERLRPPKRAVVVVLRAVVPVGAVTVQLGSGTEALVVSKPPLGTPIRRSWTASHHTWDVVEVLEESSATARAAPVGAAARTVIRDHACSASVVLVVVRATMAPAAL
jgi:hypothetical protein